MMAWNFDVIFDLYFQPFLSNDKPKVFTIYIVGTFYSPKLNASLLVSRNPCTLMKYYKLMFSFRSSYFTYKLQ